jgi:hypothetical protein
MVGMKISQVEWSKGLGGKGEDRRTFIIGAVVHNDNFATNAFYFWHKCI